MTDNLSERFQALEQSVRRAAETITRLRAERDALAAKLAALDGQRAELERLRQERRDVVAQVDTILKELDRLAL
jgi:septal ring factor EnvC (AmiA/AmiB activator)